MIFKSNRCRAKIRRMLFLNCNSFWGTKELLINATQRPSQEGKKRHSARPGTWQQLLSDVFLFTEFRLGCADRSLRLLCSWSQCTSAVTCTVWMCRCSMCRVHRLVYSVHSPLLEQLVCWRFISFAWRGNKRLRRDDETDDSGWTTVGEGEEQNEWRSSWQQNDLTHRLTAKLTNCWGECHIHVIWIYPKYLFATCKLCSSQKTGVITIWNERLVWNLTLCWIAQMSKKTTTTKNNIAIKFHPRQTHI